MLVMALTVAGSDPSGGSGLQADLKAFMARGVSGGAVPTALSVQTTRGVRTVKPLDPGSVGAQVEAVLEDAPIRAVKTGMLANAQVVRAVAKVLHRHPHVPLVVDPEIMSHNGHRLLDDHGVWATTEALLAGATLITASAEEASVFSRMPVRTLREAEHAAVAIQALGARAVLVKGGRLSGPHCVDLLFDGSQFHTVESPRLDIPRAHGAGTLLSAVITAELARGTALVPAVMTARRVLQVALSRGTVGAGGALVPDVMALAGA